MWILALAAPSLVLSSEFHSPLVKLLYLGTGTSCLFVELIPVVTSLLPCLLEFNVKPLSVRAVVVVVDMSGTTIGRM